MQLFITGTTTGVGKTVFSCELLRRWRRQGKKAIGLKPVSTGDRRDAELLAEAMDGTLSVEEVNPAHWDIPAAPLVAYRRGGKPLDLDFLCEHVARFCRRYSHVVVEGIGGWLSPLAPGITVREWVQRLSLPVILVTRSELGTLSPTLATAESILASGMCLRGIALNFHGVMPGPASTTHAEILEEWIGVPVFSFGGEAGFPQQFPDWLNS
ncbi:dethiobiotin synthase [Candidatus Methylacidithermus pantelleriae]|uniref:ATP-dependent dethiobiotin synthetase BioD n=1 Tax=Candidatus Methylacidithermus pantelleriae TaxID=2744239 RepID=A0A8J2BPW1_9BACT|nr:dethiobiotin synthase [Candidatus Methylacidithermus pantelleriae]CAF0697772.1 ATP-dependent dethiobiotin synthetase BioD [Candidatus Methylacidithermus pantelleriae]